MKYFFRKVRCLISNYLSSLVAYGPKTANKGLKAGLKIGKMFLKSGVFSKEKIEEIRKRGYFTEEEEKIVKDYIHEHIEI